MAKSVRNVTMYSVCFKGLFGRNRSEKFTCTPTIEAPADVDLTRWVSQAAEGFAYNQRAKRGKLWVTRYDNCEVDTRDSGVTSVTIPITQGVTVYSQAIGEQ